MASISNHQQLLKKVKMNWIPIDSINSLPDSILIHILSFLPATYAVRTCILSTRWKNLWASVPNLYFHHDLELHPNPSSFMNFVDQVLSFHELPRIQRLVLLCDHDIDHGIDVSRLRTWITVAIRRSVQELNVNIEAELALPQNLFTCKTLQVLKLRTGFYFEIPGPVHLPNLRVLHVYLDSPGEGVAEKLFCCCPVLEDLFIEGVVCNTEERVFVISTPSLKNLEIDFLGDNSYERSRIGFVINAPILEHLTVQDDYFARYQLKNVSSSLVKAHINIGHIGHPLREAYGKKELANQVYGLLKEISNVKYVIIGARTMGALEYADDNNLPLLFPRVTHLEMSVYDSCCWKRLPYLLHCMPNSEILVLKVVTENFYRHMDIDLDWNEPEGIPTCLLLHLKQIRLTGFKGNRYDLKLIEYLLKNAEVLIKIAINICDLEVEQSDFLKHLVLCQRGSKGCTIELS